MAKKLPGTRIGKALTAAALAAALTLTTAPAAHAYPAGYSIGSFGNSTYLVQMKQSYTNELIYVAPGHYNFEYGRKDIPQSVNSFALRPHSCVAIYKTNDAGTAWVYTGILANTANSGWIVIYPYKYVGKFNSHGKNLLLHRPYVTGSMTCG